jgi:hypothetical protein
MRAEPFEMMKCVTTLPIEHDTGLAGASILFALTVLWPSLAGSQTVLIVEDPYALIGRQVAGAIVRTLFRHVLMRHFSLELGPAPRSRLVPKECQLAARERMMIGGMPR